MKDQGMTLLELLIVVIVSCLILLVAVPSLKDLFATLEAQRVTTTIAQICRQARLAALHRGYPVALCGSSNATVCDGRWVDGVLLFVDNNHNRQKEPLEEILHFTSMSASPSVVAWSGFGGNNALLVEGFGTPYAGNGSFTYCSEDKEPMYRRQVIVSRGGRIRMSRDTNGDGIHESANGGLIDCP